MPFRFERWYLWSRQVAAGILLRVFEPLIYRLAGFWRRLLRRTTVIAVTGSLGKTTAKEALAAILGLEHPTFRSLGTQNARQLVSLNLLRARPWHRFAVIELGTAGPGQLVRSAVQVSPDVAIVLGVAATHIRSYGSVDDIAREKMQLLEGLRAGGIALINGDDPRLAAVPLGPRVRVARFGTGSNLDLRAEAISGRWPQRLRFRVVANDARVDVQTRMVGEHWVPSLLAALHAARYCGVDLRRAAEALSALPPSPGRLQPVELPNGAIVIRDEYNASPSSYDVALKVLEQARAERRVAVFGDMTDNKDKIRRRLAKLGRRVAGVCELAVFVGDHSHYAQRGALGAGLPESSAVCWTDPVAAAAYLASELRSGDLVLVKGWLSQHLERLVFAQIGRVQCWTRSCHKRVQCDVCWKLGLSGAERGTLKPAAVASPAPDSRGRDPLCAQASAGVSMDEDRVDG